MVDGVDIAHIVLPVWEVQEKKKKKIGWGVNIGSHRISTDAHKTFSLKQKTLTQHQSEES